MDDFRSARGPRSLRFYCSLSLALCTPLLTPLMSAAQNIEIKNQDLFAKSFEASRQALAEYGSGDRPEELRRIADIGYELAQQAQFSDYPFSFFLAEIPVPNAFALPGGHIFVTRGMLDLGLDDDMLACLLGHEIAHVTRAHGMRLKRRATLLNLLSLATLAGVLIGVDDERTPTRDGTYSDNRKGDLIQGTLASSVVLSELLLRNYSRDFEDEADDEGQRIAAAAGFDPAGARRLWQLMNDRLPQSEVYGYWRTHPFSDTRQRAAEVRAAELKIEDRRPADDYRALTQKALLDWGLAEPRKKSEGQQHLEFSALTAWPQGRRAEELRGKRLDRLHDTELENEELQRDYGELVRAFLIEIEEVSTLTPKSGFVDKLEQRMDELRAAADKLYPKAATLWRDGIYQTAFLETFLSNYPTAEESPEVALTLGNAYSRLGRQTDAVEQYLRAADSGPDSEAGVKAVRGLRNLAPFLDRLAALARLSAQIEDDELRQLADRRLVELAKKYDGLDNGAEYLQHFPTGDHVTTVRERQEVLAQNLYGEVLLYQAVGDAVKALEGIQQILTHAPTTRAADKLRHRAVIDS